MRIIYELQSSSDDKDFSEINDELRNSNPEYLEQFGEVGSSNWWDSIKSEKQDIQVLTGSVVSIEKLLNDNGREEDIAQIETDKAVLEVNLTYFSDFHGVRVGDELQLDSVTIYTNIDKPESAFVMDLKLCVL